MLRRVKSKLVTIYEVITRYISPATLVVLLVALIAGYLLFVPPYNGYANNGDYGRAMYVSGLYVLPNRAYNYFDYFVRQVGIMQYFNETSASLFSSQPMIIRIAILINKLFYSKTIFDVRFLATFYYIWYLATLYLLTDVLTYKLKRKYAYLTALIMTFIFADSSYTLYFSSFFAEPIMLITFIGVFASALGIARHRYRIQWPLYLIFGLDTVIFVTVKQQNAPLAFLIAIIALSFIFVVRTRGQKLFIVLGTLAVMGSGVVTYALITKDFNNINQYQSMTRGVLLNADDPGKALATGGIDRQYALLKGIPYFEAYMPVDLHGKSLEKNLLEKYNFIWILRYYLTHLDQFVALLDLSARDTQIVQLEAVGDYEKSAGKGAGAQTHYFTGYSTLKKRYYPTVFSFYILLFVGLVGLYVYAAYQGFKHHQPASIVRLALVICCAGMILAVCLISIIGDGDADLAKHLFMAPVSLDLLTVMLISDTFGKRIFQEGTYGEPDLSEVGGQP